MLGLAIDSANQSASAALWSSADSGSSIDSPWFTGLAFEALLAFEVLAPERGKADQLISGIERLLQEQGLDYRDLDVIAANRGPGSFTGIRSAVALARGLALAAELPVIGVTSHEALAASLERADGRATMIVQDARRGEVYAQSFAADGQPLAKIEAKAPALVADQLETGAWRLAGSGAVFVAKNLTGDLDVEIIEAPPVDASMVMLAATVRLSRGETPASGFGLQPLYVRVPDAVPPTPLIPPTKPATEARA